MVKVVSEFVGRKLSPEQIEQIAKQCTFEEMRNNNMVNREVLPVPDLFDMSKSKFMRKGIIGDWKNQFTDKESEQMDRMYLERLKSIGLNLAFDYEQAQQMIGVNGRIIQLITDTRTTTNNGKANSMLSDTDRINENIVQYKPPDNDDEVGVEDNDGDDDTNHIVGTKNPILI